MERSDWKREMERSAAPLWTECINTTASVDQWSS